VGPRGSLTERSSSRALRLRFALAILSTGWPHRANVIEDQGADHFLSCESSRKETVEGCVSYVSCQTAGAEVIGVTISVDVECG
jgi:hypothetical protein